jgi:hypothetical protein
MAKSKGSTAKGAKKRAARSGFVVGRASFSKISAVEGIRLTGAMKTRAATAARKGLTAEEYRQMIVRSYRKA